MSQSLYQNTKICGSPVKKARNSSNNLFGRHFTEDLNRGNLDILTLLELLGFVVNYQKQPQNPIQSIEFLGVLVNSVTLDMSLPLKKVKSIRRECRKVLENPNITVTDLARLLGKLSASIKAVFPACLHDRHI